MHPLVEKRRVDQPVDAEEVELVDDRHHQDKQRQRHRVLGEANQGT